MTQPCKTCPTPNACEIGNLCAYRDMEVIERVMKRMDEMESQEDAGSARLFLCGLAIASAFAVWLVFMLVKTGV